MGLARLIETLAMAASFRSDLLPRTVQVDASADSRSPGVSFSTVSQQDDDGDPDFPHPLFIPTSTEGKLLLLLL